ncbi:MAG TPA: sugar transferase [Terracidiphilus sp.]|jgi:exopolysaccharide biosynthesis polyprenyl glycosylphosphotransferase|nr:sugar transferase [Terracidiphilus sp.]
MGIDVLTVLISVIVATTFELHTNPVTGARAFYRGTLFHGRSMGILLALMCGFTIALIAISRRMHLYNPASLTNHLHEQRMSMQACFTAGLLLTGALYLLHAADIPRSIVLVTLSLVTVLLSLRRLVYRTMLYRRYDRGLDIRNVLIVGTGTEAQALRRHLERIRHLGYKFKGFVRLHGSCEDQQGDVDAPAVSPEVLFQQVRGQFVDEVIFASPCGLDVMQDVLEQARIHGVDLRLVPDLYGGLAWNSPVEYLGQFPTIPLHRGHVPEIGLVLKRILDVLISGLILLVILPVLVCIAIAIKLDSAGPIFYRSDRIGKKGRVFKCLKFRTMVRDAEGRRAAMEHMNERDGVLFKIAKDPRITRVGRILRKYSLDELPQFLNVLSGDMSVVGPRPPLASEVKEYKLGHLRRLSVTPGITGLWQVQGRRDPSFDSYVSLDLTYIENWSLWLDLKIMVRTAAVIFSGTGT